MPQDVSQLDPVSPPDLPVGLERRRHVDLRGRTDNVWLRRVGLLGLLAIMIIALIGVFGQRDRRSVAEGPTATLTLLSPDRLRGGLVFTSEVDVTAHAALSDMRLVLARGWFTNMTFNGIAPQPSDESSRDGDVEYEFGPVRSGSTFRTYISWQTNPTNVGTHRQDIELLDGDTSIATIRRTFTVLP